MAHSFGVDRSIPTPQRPSTVSMRTSWTDSSTGGFPGFGCVVTRFDPRPQVLRCHDVVSLRAGKGGALEKIQKGSTTKGADLFVPDREMVQPPLQGSKEETKQAPMSVCLF